VSALRPCQNILNPEHGADLQSLGGYTDCYWFMYKLRCCCWWWWWWWWWWL